MRFYFDSIGIFIKSKTNLIMPFIYKKNENEFLIFKIQTFSV